MIVDETQLTKEKSEDGETWTTPWRMTRSEAYVDLVDATDYATRHGQENNLSVAPALEDDWDENRHRAVYTFGKVQDMSGTSQGQSRTSPGLGEKDAGTEKQAAAIRAGGGTDDQPGEERKAGEKDSRPSDQE